MAKKKPEIRLEKKSKLSSSEWKELGWLLRALIDQEMLWLNSYHAKQAGSCVVAFGRIWSELTVEESRDSFKNDTLIYTARDPKTNKIVGFCSIEEKPKCGWATCNGLYVDPKWRRRGIATDFLSRAFEKVKTDGLDSIELRVSLRNKAARALYKKFGFSTVALKMEKWVW